MSWHHLCLLFNAACKYKKKKKKRYWRRAIWSFDISHILTFSAEEDMLQNPKTHSKVSAEIFSFIDGAQTDRGGSFLATLGDRRRRLRPTSASQNFAFPAQRQALVSPPAGNRVVTILWLSHCLSSFCCLAVVINCNLLIEVVLILNSCLLYK